MKKLIVSLKSASESLEDFKKAFKKARRHQLKGDHYEISFSQKKDFDRFVKNLGVLSAIYKHKPKSVYELSKILNADLSNLSKLIQFFETIGALTIKISQEGGRLVKTPVVGYKQIEIDLDSAA